MALQIHEDHASWVLRIFYWFGREGRSMRWIARELTRLKAPKDHRATTAAWKPKQVRNVLTNKKYIGVWRWGANTNKRNPMTGLIRQEARSPEEYSKWTRDRPHLRIISDELWEATRGRLDRLKKSQPRGRKGRLQGSLAGNASNPRHLLQGLLLCGSCLARGESQASASFVAGGGHGRYMQCRNALTGLCPCKKTVSRALAERLILRVISQRVLANPVWLRAVVSALLAHHRAIQQKLPTELQQVESDLTATEKKITRLLDEIEEGKAAPEISQRLAHRRAEKEALLRRRAEMQRFSDATQQEPTEEWIREQFSNLESLLHSGGPAAAHALRALVGGQIILTEIERPGYHKSFLRGRCTLRTGGLGEAAGVTLGKGSQGPGAEAEVSEEIVIDFCQPDPIETLAERAKEFWDAGKRYHEIAAELDCSLKRVRRAMKHWFETRGLPQPDGRKSPSGHWPSKKPPAALVELIKNLKDQGLEIGQIALQVCHSRGYVAKLLKRWYEERGLQVPDWRRRLDMNGDQAA